MKKSYLCNHKMEQQAPKNHRHTLTKLQGVAHNNTSTFNIHDRQNSLIHSFRRYKFPIAMPLMQAAGRANFYLSDSRLMLSQLHNNRYVYSEEGGRYSPRIFAPVFRFYQQRFLKQFLLPQSLRE